ncbi:MAG: TolC family protein [Desulfuromonadales bacterium]|nr:TolC family protein [Desulfuromonadales bacterium]
MFKKSLITSLFLLFFPLFASAGLAATPEPDGLPLALQLSITRHPKVLSKLDELTSLGFEVDAAKAGRYPTLSLQGQTYSDENSQIVARLQQPLWAGGRIDGAIDLSRSKLRSSDAALLAVRRQLMEETAALYANLQGARKRLQAAERNLEEHENLLGLISRRQAGSIASEADVRLARSRVAQATAQLEQLRGLVEKSLTDLLAQTQLPVAALLPVDESLLQLPDPATILSEADIQSPLVQQLINEVEVMRIQSDLRRSDLLPVLSAQIDQDMYVASRAGEESRDTRVGLVLTGNLEGGGLAGFGRVKSAKAMVNAARKDVESARNEVRRRTQGLMAERHSLNRVRVRNEELVLANEETLASFLRQYDAGKKSWVDVLNAQRELGEARQSLEQTLTQYVETTLRLAAITGRLDSYAGLKP